MVLTFCINSTRYFAAYCFLIVSGFYRLRPGPVCDFGTERALAEPLGPDTTNFPSSWTRFTLLTELNLTVPKGSS